MQRFLSLTEYGCWEDQLVKEGTGDYKPNRLSTPRSSIDDFACLVTEDSSSTYQWDHTHWRATNDPDTTVPSAPTNLSETSHTATSVDIDWDASSSSDIDDYLVYVDGYEEIEIDAGTTTATVEGLRGDQTYDVSVSAVDNADNESSEAGPISISTDSGGDPVSHYPLDGSSATDATGDNDGTLNGGITTGVTGQIDSAFQFDGSDDYIDLGSQVASDLTNSSMTWATWIKTSGPSRQSILAANTSGYGNSILLFVYEDNLALFDGEWRTTGVTVTDGAWHHVAMTHEPNDSDLSLFVDGARYDLSLTSSLNSDDIMSIGQEYDGSSSTTSDFFDGKIDDVRFYDRALVQSAVESLASMPNSGLISHYTLDGSSATDSEGDNDGTLNGGITTGATGKVNDCFQFDGSDDYVDLGTQVSSELAGGSFTWTAWVKTSATIDSEIVGCNTSGYGDNLQFRVKDSVLALYDGSTWYEGQTTINDDSWHHVAVTLASDDTLNLYVDGQNDGGSSTSTRVNSDDIVSIGQEYDGSSSSTSNHFDGKIDEVRFYNEELSGSEIQSLYDSA
ncbi:LamG-like jellyroll fold domain-containing protein [Haloarcula marina]|uniref:LamG-like jellyroll fold domain-containing protein n=1 Tax=Haloarcula marina TaxID=2961574 RepID=UPI0020B6C199|nr:LamG-like jellyroll fold domain-containing protein [Halomicroarcula marina]